MYRLFTKSVLIFYISETIQNYEKSQDTCSIISFKKLEELPSQEYPREIPTKKFQINISEM